MSPHDTLEIDLLCARCGYNLRGLTIVHRCPECEFPAFRSYFSKTAAMPVKRPNGDAMISPRRALPVLADLMQVKPEAIALVAACVTRASQIVPKPTGRRSHASAKLVCEVLRDVTLKQNGSEKNARQHLSALGLETGESVGRIVAGLVEAGIVGANENDCPSDFDGLFTLDTLFTDTNA
jgi:uncharacterized repeat protein (TIGR04138 family)